ncbi:MAG: paraslipin [Gammaproteobacteria bacterium]|nr:paraslipin [Gammaproteobacteria bacterium]
MGLNYLFNFWTGLTVAALFLLKGAVRFVPQNRAFIIERFGRYHKTMTAGLNFMVPFIDRIAADRNLKEQAINIAKQSAITADNISLGIDGILYIKVIDPYKATYGVDTYDFAVSQLAQTTMRSEIGKLELDKTFEERDSLNINIVAAINKASEPWGVQVLRYEIKDIDPPNSVLNAMEQQMRAEREKRAAILESEGMRQAAINRAEGEKKAIVLAAEASKSEMVLKAQGEAEAITTVATARAEALTIIGKSAATFEGEKAVQLELATEAIAAKAKIAKEGTIVLMDGNKSEAGSVVTEAVAIVAAMNRSEAFRPAVSDA